ncbi:MarR family winged helix-turn-helix transcriptional regulator [Microbacterium sp. B2969]|uniref:MarR family winged helix-turn-helix transcriptional regulator n=1 Tax=Microbacterium alkaliflavum TaxID=3248839 RepID=A0ABW7Q4M5_9MICO
MFSQPTIQQALACCRQPCPHPRSDPLRTAEHLRYLILAAQREGNRQLTAALTRIDLTPAQSEALRIIADHGPLSLKELGDMLVCDSGTNPSRIVDRLVTADLVRRDADELDRRQIRLTVTARGADRSDEVRAIEEQLYDAIDDALDADGSELLVRSLQALAADSPAGIALNKRLAAEPPT